VFWLIVLLRLMALMQLVEDAQAFWPSRIGAPVPAGETRWFDLRGKTTVSADAQQSERREERAEGSTRRSARRECQTEAVARSTVEGAQWGEWRCVCMAGREPAPFGVSRTWHPSADEQQQQPGTRWACRDTAHSAVPNAAECCFRGQQQSGRRSSSHEATL
jgi:hypothetical protein